MIPSRCRLLVTFHLGGSHSRRFGNIAGFRRSTAEFLVAFFHRFLVKLQYE